VLGIINIIDWGLVYLHRECVRHGSFGMKKEPLSPLLKDQIPTLESILKFIQEGI
jgi:hypothetical protein